MARRHGTNSASDYSVSILSRVGVLGVGLVHVTAPDAHSGGVSGLVRDFAYIAFFASSKKVLILKINFGGVEHPRAPGRTAP